MSSNLKLSGIKARMDYAKKLNCLQVVNSDSHHTSNTGRYFTEIEGWYDDEKDILNALREGKVLSFSYPPSM